MTFYVSKAVEMIEPTTVVYMRRTGGYGQENMALMQRFKKWIADNALADDDLVIMAMALDDPAQTAACACRYEVCMRCPQGKAFDQAPVGIREMAGGKYMIFLLPHTAQALQTAWQECFAILPELGQSFDKERPIMERYPQKLVEAHYCELCVPIV